MGQRRRISVTVISEVPLVAAGLRSLLEPHSDRIEVVDPGARTGCDVALFHPTGRADADERALTELTAETAGQHVAVYARSMSMRAVREARRLGVHSFLATTMGGDDLAAALEQLAHGAVVDAASAPPAGRATATWMGRDDGLTERESQVLVLCADGLSNQQIADALYVNLETVKSHLKRAYSRLGLRNRAHAVGYVHRAMASGSLLPQIDVDAAPPDPVRVEVPSDDEVDVPPEIVAERLALAGLDEARRATLRRFEPAVTEGAAGHVRRMIARWEQHEETAPLLADRAGARRLVEHQQRYLVELVAGEFGVDHARSMMRIGATHHRLRLFPEWYLASYVHLVCDHLPLLLGDDHDVEAVSALIASCLFDASLVLDAYEMAVADEIVRSVRRSTPAIAEPVTAPEQPARAPVSTRRPVAKLTATADEAEMRRRFIGIDAPVVDALRGIAGSLAAAMPGVLADFYAFVGSSDAVKGLVPPATVSRLLDEVGAFWEQTVRADFDRAHAASRLRVGAIHEQIGLAPQFYLAGLARQLSGLLRAIAATSDDVRRDVDALVRAAFYDMTYVIDAYLEARAATLMQTGRYASQVIAGLANGVAIVDPRDRIEFANEPFIDLVGVAPAVLHRMPVDSALPIPGISEIVDEARRVPSGRHTAARTVRGRTLRIVALRMEGTTTGRGMLVAIVVDDITDVLLADADIAHDDRLFAHVLDAVDAVVWEIDVASLAFEAVSSSCAALFGARDIDLLGGRPMTEFMPGGDARRFRDVCATLAVGDHAQLDHLVVGPEGVPRPVRSSFVATEGSTGEPTISGVTVLAPAADGRSVDALRVIAEMLDRDDTAGARVALATLLARSVGAGGG